MKSRLRALIEGLQEVERVSPEAEPWARERNVTVGPVDAEDGSELAERLSGLGWEREPEDVSGPKAWGFYTPA